MIHFRLNAGTSEHLALATLKSVLVKQVLCHLIVVGIHAGEVCNVISQLLYGLHLLVQVVGLQEVTQLEEGRINI